jgi:hypothetical protein
LLCEERLYIVLNERPSISQLPSYLLRERPVMPSASCVTGRRHGALAGLRAQLNARQAPARGVKKRARRAKSAVAEAKSRAKARMDAAEAFKAAGRRKKGKVEANPVGPRKAALLSKQQAILQKLVARR